MNAFAASFRGIISVQYSEYHNSCVDIETTLNCNMSVYPDSSCEDDLSAHSF